MMIILILVKGNRISVLRNQILVMIILISVTIIIITAKRCQFHYKEPENVIF